MAVVPAIHFDKPWYLAFFMLASIIQLFLTSAPIFGYSSMLVIFKEKKFYQQLCKLKNNNESVTSREFDNSTEFDAETWDCSEQDSALNLLFAFGIVFHTGVKFIIGIGVDRIGAQSCQYMGSVFVLLFSLTLAYAKQEKEYLVFISFFFLSIGSSVLMFCSYQAVNIIFKKKKALFLCLMSGSVDSSTAVFIIFLELYQGDISFSSITLMYGCFVVVFVIITTSILYPSKEEMAYIIDSEVKKILNPREEQIDLVKFSQELSASYHGGFTSSFKAYKTAVIRNLVELSLEDGHHELSLSLSHSLGFSYSQSELSTSFESSASTANTVPWSKRGPYGIIKEHVYGYGSDEYSADKIADPEERSVDDETLPLVNTAENYFKQAADIGLKHYMCSKFHLFCIITLSLVMLKLVYFIGNLDKYLSSLTDYETGVTYIKIFGFVQFAGILVGPVAGLLFLRNESREIKSADQVKYENIKSLIIPAVIFLLNITLLNGLQLFQNLYLSIPIFLLYLTGNGLLWCFASSFYALIFPPQYFCSLYGSNMVFCGLFSFVQYPLLSMEQNLFDGQQFWTNVVFFIILIIPWILPAYLKYYCLKYERKEADNSIPNDGCYL